MRSQNWIVLAAMLSGICPAAVSSAAEVEQGEAVTSASVVNLNGKIVTSDDITSFAMHLELAEGRSLPSQEDLLDEYILTHLYDKIPTTATLTVDGNERPSPTSVPVVSQRTLLKRELQKVVSADVDVPREAMEEWYEKNVERYTQPERVHAYHLFLETSEDTPTSSPEKVRNRLTQIKNDLDKGTSFSVAASEFSEAASADSGGEIGKIRRAQPIGPLSKPMNIELENAFFALAPSKVSDIIETRHGMHLLYVAEKETTYTPTLDDLITSRILPGALTQDMATSALRTLISDTVKKYDGKPVPTEGEVTTDTVAFQFNGKDFTFGSLETIYGPRFSSFLETVKSDSERLNELKQQAMEDEAAVQAAIDKGIENTPEVKEQLDFLKLREKSVKRIQAITEAESAVSEQQIQERYASLVDQLRQPEAEGTVITISAKPTSGTAEEARALEYTRRTAEEIRERLQTEDFDKVVESLVNGKNDVVTTVTKVPRHVVGQTTGSQERFFDQGISRIQGEEGISDVIPSGSHFTISKLDNRYPGEPMALETVRGRIEAMVRNESEMGVRKQMVDRLVKQGLAKFLPGADVYKSGDGESETMR